MRLFTQLLIGMVAIAYILPFAQAAESTSIEINPSVALFKNIQAGSGSHAISLEVRNKGSSSLVVDTLNITGDHANQFSVTNNQCNNASLATSATCTVEVTFTPTERGHKQALLNIATDLADTPLLQAFLTNYEDGQTQSSRRLPPVLYALNIPEEMRAGQSYTLAWSILGYHDDYLSSVAIFDCTNVAAGTCGNSYNDANRIFTEVGADNGTTNTSWHNDGIYAKEHKFTAQFTPSVGQVTDIVMRFYRLNTDDKNAGGSGLSLVIPGNLSDEYYDKQGRRIKKKLLP